MTNTFKVKELLAYVMNYATRKNTKKNTFPEFD